MFLVGFLGWTWDAFDFFTVSMTATEIAKDFDVSVTSVTWVSQVPFIYP
jgi:SHS family lactate transporter-like MFS transporter